MSALELRGTLTALVTPFSAEGAKVDWDAFDRHLLGQLAGGVSGLVPCGTTGETPTLSPAEQHEIIGRTVRACKGKVKVVAGTGSNDTHKSIEASKAAADLGVDAIMLVMPYYNKPSQAGLLRHVQLVAQAVNVPVVLYNIPGRSVVNLAEETLLRILESCPNVVALKDATGNVAYCQSILSKVGDRLSVLCGDDALTLAMMSVGAKGVISVTSNVYPAQVSEVTSLVAQGNFAAARRRHFALLPVHEAMFVEPNPVPAKAALASRGQMNAAVRLPLVEAAAEQIERITRTLQDFEAR